METDIRFVRHDGEVRAQALHAFRRRHRRNRLARLGGIFTLVAIALFLSPSRKIEIAKVPPSVIPNPPKREVAVEGVPLLSDEQLLAMFPPGTCYIAEVSGKKRLIFRTGEMRTRYLN